MSCYALPVIRGRNFRPKGAVRRTLTSVAKARVGCIRSGGLAGVPTGAVLDAVKKFDFVLHGANAGGNYEAAIAACKAANPTSIHAGYVIAKDYGGQINAISTITRSGNSITITTADQTGATGTTGPTAGQDARVQGSFRPTNGSDAAGIAVLANTNGFDGQWPVTATTTFTITCTVSGAAASAANDTSGEGVMVCKNDNSSFYIAGPAANKSWWKWKKNQTKRRTCWNITFNNFDMNMTTFSTPDGRGNYWPQYKASRDNAVIFNVQNGFDYYWTDNVQDERQDNINNDYDASLNRLVDAGTGLRSKADWKSSGTPQDITDADIISAHKLGHVAYANALKAGSIGRAKSPNMKVMVNHDGDLSGEWSGQFDSVFLEAFTGTRGYAADTALGFLGAMQRLITVQSRLLVPGGLILFATYLNTITNYQGVRYGFCFSCLQDNVIFALGGTTDDPQGTAWFDEYDQSFGLAVDPTQSIPRASGLMIRRFQNACVVLNPTGAPIATSELSGEGWRKFDASKFSGQDTAHNDGSLVLSLTVEAKDGFVLVKG